MHAEGAPTASVVNGAATKLIALHEQVEAQHTAHGVQSSA
jgi:hypothetical protein